MTKIEWTEKTWNPIVGCSIVSPGCTNCYAMTKRVNGNAVWTGKVALAPAHILTEPLRRKKPTTYFVNSMGDLFHEDVPDAWIDQVFAVMALSPQHTFQVLTKRSARMRAWFKSRDREPVSCVSALAIEHPEILSTTPLDADRCIKLGLAGWPLPNVWLGVSAERQTEADTRIPDLLATPAAVRFVSAEPLLGPIDFDAVKFTAVPGFFGSALRWHHRGKAHVDDGTVYPTLDWIIVGGESGTGARPMHPDWARSIRDQCLAAGVAFFFKQWGEWANEESHGPLVGEVKLPMGITGHAFQRWGKGKTGRLLDGREWSGTPSAQPEQVPV